MKFFNYLDCVEVKPGSYLILDDYTHYENTIILKNKTVLIREPWEYRNSKFYWWQASEKIYKNRDGGDLGRYIPEDVLQKLPYTVRKKPLVFGLKISLKYKILEFLEDKLDKFFVDDASR